MAIKSTFLSLLIFLCSTLSFALPSANNKGKNRLFGVNLRWVDSAKNKNFIKKFLAANSQKLQITLDPDCVYKKVGNIFCGRSVNKKILSQIESIAKALYTETKGAFQYKTPKNKRDFAGISQGFVLDLLRRQKKNKWLVDFAGDIYLEGPMPLESSLYISDPLFDPVPYAKVDMKKGWMITADLNTKTKQAKNLKSEQIIKRVVLFANSKMSGARLDGWSTAIVSGGMPVIRNLLKLKKYKNQWGYLYFDTKDRPICSQNISCSLKQRGLRKVTVNL